MAKYKKNKLQQLQHAVNEVEDIKADEMRDLLKMQYHIKCKFKNQKQKELSETIKNNRITFVTGSPGTGKTFIALKTGLELLKESKMEDILLTTPIVEVSPKSIGALPGDLELKIINYFQHFYDNIEKILDKKTLLFLQGSGKINNRIVNFMRGDTFGKLDNNGNPLGTFCILDEAQNLTKVQLKTYISRLGENSKMVILGDIDQCDLSLGKNEVNALEDAINRFSNMQGIGIVKFTDDDIVRDKFLIEVMKRYKE